MKKIILGARPSILGKCSNPLRSVQDHILLFPQHIFQKYFMYYENFVALSCRAGFEGLSKESAVAHDMLYV